MQGREFHGTLIPVHSSTRAFKTEPATDFFFTHTLALYHWRYNRSKSLIHLLHYASIWWMPPPYAWVFEIRHGYCFEHLLKILELSHLRIRTLIISFDWSSKYMLHSFSTVCEVWTEPILKIGVNTRRRHTNKKKASTLWKANGSEYTQSYKIKVVRTLETQPQLEIFTSITK